MSLEQDITQLMEKDIFKPASKEELQDRQKDMLAKRVELRKKHNVLITKFEANKANIIEDPGNVCPFCGNDDIEATDTGYTEEGLHYEYLMCNECDIYWTEVYKLVDIRPAKGRY